MQSSDPEKVMWKKQRETESEREHATPLDLKMEGNTMTLRSCPEHCKRNTLASGASAGSTAPRNLGFGPVKPVWTSGFRNCKRVNLCCHLQQSMKHVKPKDILKNSGTCGKRQFGEDSRYKLNGKVAWRRELGNKWGKRNSPGIKTNIKHWPLTLFLQKIYNFIRKVYSAAYALERCWNQLSNRDNCCPAIWVWLGKQSKLFQRPLPF